MLVVPVCARLTLSHKHKTANDKRREFEKYRYINDLNLLKFSQGTSIFRIGKRERKAS
jgi:hypothetical protein